jgi:RNA polymerase sigma-70 factor (ECF subfamily)
MAWFWEGVEVEWLSTNGQASALLRHGDSAVGMVTLSASAEGVDQVLWMFNPEKITERSVPEGAASSLRFADVAKPGGARA